MANLPKETLEELAKKAPKKPDPKVVSRLCEEYRALEEEKFALAKQVADIERRSSEQVKKMIAAIGRKDLKIGDDIYRFRRSVKGRFYLQNLSNRSYLEVE